MLLTEKIIHLSALFEFTVFKSRVIKLFGFCCCHILSINQLEPCVCIVFLKAVHSLMMCCFFVEFLFAEYTKNFKLKRRDSSGFNQLCSDTDS